ncbi:ABC transporter ATP-binding protein [Tepidanaerobacter acetatoxydans]|uniref:ABC transporter ATP-binding protein n=1 Tax=Tepidanaerobacter acetatoxydans TaxID=499229 RepID=UPI001BD3B92C|nr:ABC transporter ATP-binding protein [Tepidanaerobacter acetatoxydans]
MKGQNIIEIQSLTKCYGSITAVDNLNLSISKGEIFGLLGPNGAGKTTTILMLMGLSEPTSGTISVAGLNPTREPIKVKRIVGYMPDNIGFYGDMTGRENLYYTAKLNRIPEEQQDELIDSLLAKVGLKDAADRKVREYSRGMRQRLGVADVLLKDPEVVFLDEPTLGLDPEGTAELLEIITELGKKEGKTVLISSHLLHQVQAICDRVGIFVKGKLVAAGTISELAQKIGGERAIEIKASPIEAFPSDVVRSMPGVNSISIQNDMIVIDGAGQELAPQIVRELVAQNMDIYHLKIRGSDLDDIYHRYFQEGGANSNE